MFSGETVARIRAQVEAVAGFPIPYPAECREGEGLHVSLSGGRAVIEAEDLSALARGFFLLARCVKEDRSTLDVRQSRHFASCGVMADCSRGAVLTREAACRLIDRLSALGMNLLMLYTEDTYAVPEYPYQGYLRGRYSQEELRALDGYAASMGVELVP